MFAINYRDPRPIYEQIMDELRKMIISGVFKPDEKLPSVRELAQQLAINPNTIQRAYRELEISGYIYSVAGKGNFAAGRHGVDEGRKTGLPFSRRPVLTSWNASTSLSGEIAAMTRLSRI